MAPEGQRPRRLVAAYLTERRDGPLLEWVQQLAAAGLLAQAVRDGLRLVHWLCRLPGAGDLLRRGVLAEAVMAGVLRPVPPDRLPIVSAHAGVKASSPPEEHADPDIESQLDRLLGSDD